LSLRGAKRRGNLDHHEILFTFFVILDYLW